MNKKHLPHLFLSFISLVLLSAQVFADPGWADVTAEPVSPAAATAYYASQTAQPSVITKSSTSSPSATTSAAASAAATPEITELARALQNDAVLMYEYVLNHIDYVPYYGSLKGATLTLLERSGNDFDQASLLIALFREAGFTASFLYGDITIPTSGTGDDRDMANWLGLDADANLVAQILANGGIPGTVSTSTTQMTRVWVQVATPEGTFVLDPAFKTYDETAGINLNTAMGYDKTALLAAAGGEVGVDYVRNLNDVGLQSQLVSYAHALSNYLKTNLPNAAMDEVIGGRKIRQQTISSLPVSLPFSNNLLETWTDIPIQYIHTLQIQHGNINYLLNIPDIAGKKLAITYDTGASASTASTQSVFATIQTDVADVESVAAISIPATSTATPELADISAPVAVPAGAPATQTVIEVNGGTTTLVRKLQESALVKSNQPPAESSPTTQAASAGTTIPFGTVNQSQQKDVSITLNNNNAVTVTYTSSLTTNPEGAYSIIQNSVISIPPFSSDSITIRLSGIGQTRGTKTATWRYVVSAPGFNDSTVDNPLTGFVAESPSVLSGSHGASYQAYLNNPLDSTPRFNNSGNFNVDITSVTPTGVDANRFQIISGGGAGSVASGAFRDISVRYLADLHGTHAAFVTVVYNYDGINGYSLNLPLNAQTFFQPDQIGSLGINFGTNFLGSPIDGNALFKNNGGVDLTINSVTLTGADANRFQRLSGTGAGTLTSGQTRTIGVRYLADVNASHTATVQVNFTYDGLTYNYTLPLLGQTVLAADFTGSSAPSFGQHYLNDVTNQNFMLKNSGSLTLTINSMTLTGPDSARFNLISGNGAGSLAPGATRNIDVEYLADLVGVHAANITVNYTYDGFTNTVNLVLSGETLPTPPAQLWLDDVLLVEELTAGSSGDFIITVDHPYAADGGTYADASDTYSLKRGSSTYVLLSDMGGSSQGLLLKQRQRRLEQLRADGFADTSREVLTESLMVMGQTWMRQTALSDNLLAKIANVIHVFHHRFGIMAQETGYFIDIKTQQGYTTTRRTAFDNSDAHFKAAGFLTSALEHGVLEQLQGASYPAASTIKLINLANANSDKIFFVDATNYTSVEPQLSNYSAADLATFQNLVNDPVQPAILILPENGQIALLQWQGKGYVSYSQSGSGNTNIGMIIGGDYFGGYAAIAAPVNTDVITSENSPETKLRGNINNPQSKEPVDMASGAYLFANEDLSLGGVEPLGLHLRRGYNSDEHTEQSVIGYGWKHGYDIEVDIHSDVAAGLGGRAPRDAISMLVSSVITLDLMTPSIPAAKDWGCAALLGQWSMDQLFENAASVRIQDKALTYILQHDGSFSPPPGTTTDLVLSGGLYSLQERFGATIDFNIDKKISSWSDSDGNTMNFVYQAEKLSTITDAFNRVLTFNYVGEQLDNVQDSVGRSVSYGYDGAGDLVTFTDAENKDWPYGYDSNHRILTISDPLNAVLATNTYNTLEDVATQTYPREGNNTTTFNYYFSDFRNIEKDSDGGEMIYFFDRQGRNTAFKDALGNRASSQYDGQNHVVLQTEPRGNSSNAVFDGNHNLTHTFNALNQEVKSDFDIQHRLTDSFRRAQPSGPYSLTSHFEYDAEHHLELTRDPLNNDFSSTFYPNGQVLMSTDGRNTVTTYTYDIFGNPDTTKVGTHPVVDQGYDTVGRRTSLLDQEGALTQFQYDDRNLLKKIIDPLLQETNITYDDAGRQDIVTDRNGDTVNYDYTATGKVKIITATDVSAPAVSTVSFSYTPAYEDVDTMTDSLGITDYGYDAARRLTSQIDPHGFSMGYDYDAAGNLETLTYPGNKTVSYTYDGLNRLETVTIDWLGQMAIYHYDGFGRLDFVDNFNATKTDYGYDVADRLTSLNNTRSDTSTIASIQFPVLDGNGNREQEIREEPQLPVSLQEESHTRTYNAKKNRLQTAGSDTFGYDDEGQTTDKSGTPYSWDVEHRLTGIGANTQFFYDGVGNRLKVSRSGTSTKYLYDTTGNLLAEADNAGAIQRYYIHGTGLMAMVEGANVYTYHYDATGNTLAMTDQSQAIVNAYTYTPYGRITDRAETVPQPFTYVGQFGVMTEPDGLLYMRARYYDPTIGRFISEDPIGFEGGLNLFAYASGNPLIVIDPFGLAGTCASTDCIIYGGTQASNISGPSLRDLNETTAGEVAAVLTAVSSVTGVGGLVSGSIALGTISFGTGIGAAIANPSNGNLIGTAVSVASRGFIRPSLGNEIGDVIDGYNLLSQSRQLLNENSFQSGQALNPKP